MECMKKGIGKDGEKVVAVSGGFDPIHVGHVRMLRAAKALGTRLVVIMNNDHWLRAKKGFVFMPEEERKELIEALACVDEVVLTGHMPDDPDRSVVKALAKVRPHVFANGGDRKSETDIPEAIFCRDEDIEMVFNVGHGGKVSSSSDLAKSAAEAIAKLGSRKKA